MNNQVPEYFVALVKQYANLANNQQSLRAVTNISDSLHRCLDDKSRRWFFYIAPDYLSVRGKMFLTSLKSKNRTYQHSILMDRLRLQQNLTDDTEVENLLSAYLKAVAIVVGPKNTKKLQSALPAEITTKITQ
ncbi:MAG: hypothetical protein QG675_247 [Patescibacteria group bacterium]|jgi:hypothetical protein|nr:hypothetical protein [Patescibacteria group bacterium]